MSSSSASLTNSPPPKQNTFLMGLLQSQTGSREYLKESRKRLTLSLLLDKVILGISDDLLIHRYKMIEALDWKLARPRKTKVADLYDLQDIPEIPRGEVIPGKITVRYHYHSWRSE